MSILALIFSLVGIFLSLLLIGIIPAFIGFLLGMSSWSNEHSVTSFFAALLGILGVIMSVIVYLNTYGYANPVSVFNGTATPLETPMFFSSTGEETEGDTTTTAESDEAIQGAISDTADAIGNVTDSASALASDVSNELSGNGDGTGDGTGEGESDSEGASNITAPLSNSHPSSLTYGGNTSYSDAYAHCYDYMFTNVSGKNIDVNGTFYAIGANGETLSATSVTLSSVPADSNFVIEGVFNKNIGDVDHVVYDISTNESNANDFATDMVDVYVSELDNGIRVEAVNKSDKELRVNVHIQFYNGTTFLQNTWVVPSDTFNYTLSPNSTATKDAICRAGSFSSYEMFYTATYVNE